MRLLDRRMRLPDGCVRRWLSDGRMRRWLLSNCRLLRWL
jgi:hypothetical protein